MKTTQFIARSSRIALRHNSLRTGTITNIRPVLVQSSTTLRSLTAHTRSFTSAPYIFKGLQPDTSDPKAPNTTAEPQSEPSGQPAELTDAEFHEIADQYLNTLQQVLEEKSEDASKGYEIEYSAGVMTLTTPSGTYIINKQPPNKQIWLSSPITGPKRYDWVISGAGQMTKEGTETDVGDDGTMGGGKWTYLRDGSTLSDLLKAEVDVQIAAQDEADAITGREGPGGGGVGPV